MQVTTRQLAWFDPEDKAEADALRAVIAVVDRVLPLIEQALTQFDNCRVFTLQHPDYTVTALGGFVDRTDAQTCLLHLRHYIRQLVKRHD